MLPPKVARDCALEVVKDINRICGSRWALEQLAPTCEHCLSNDDCEFAFDPYNCHGDCLAEK